MNIGVLPKPPRFLELSEVLTLHDSAIDEFGGSHGVRDKGLLDSALAMPRQSFDDEFAHAIPFGMAAAYAYHICKNHPFVDGNKRTALAAMVVFLHMNGWDLTVQDLDAADQILGVATGAVDKVALEAWLVDHCKSRPSIELRDFFASLTSESDYSFIEASAAGGGAEIGASYEDAAQTIPVLNHLAQRSVELRNQGKEIEAMVFAARAQLLIAIYRIAEDMGYEW